MRETNLALGTDVSRWQGIIDFEKMRTAGASFVFLKASQGNWEDRNFRSNYEQAKRAGLLVGAYHYFSWDISYQDQARFFASLLMDFPPDLPPVLDYEERTTKFSGERAASFALAFLIEIERRTGRLPMLYTSPGFWASHGSRSPLFKKYPLWIAHYKVYSPNVPYPWDGWEFWQFSEEGDGLLFGAESKEIDLNYFKGSVEELYAKYGKGGEQPKEESEEGAKIVLHAVHDVNVRGMPRISAQIIGEVRAGQDIEVLDMFIESQSRVWVKHKGGWSACVYDGKQFFVNKK